MRRYLSELSKVVVATLVLPLVGCGDAGPPALEVVNVAGVLAHKELPQPLVDVGRKVDYVVTEGFRAGLPQQASTFQEFFEEVRPARLFGLCEVSGIASSDLC